MSLLSPPPPASISRDDYGAADSARRRFAQKSRMPHISSLPSLKFWTSKTRSIRPLSPSYEPPNTDITLTPGPAGPPDSFRDKYEWAVIYENQRGLMAFSVPYYSRLSLLPTDPPAFTVPDASSKSKSVSVNLADYPLPDGSWKWVSKSWMIDMRSDNGEVQHDGFEYNWTFRKHNWSAQVGAFSVGGWVRRRRWIRLMMRQGMHHGDAQNSQSAPIMANLRSNSDDSFSSFLWPRHHIASDDLKWTDEDVENNWLKCRMLMKRLGRDGRKLELWQSWLSFTAGGKDKILANSRDNVAIETNVADDLNSEIYLPPSKDQLVAILRIHGEDLLQIFVYPESRATLLMKFADKGLLHELNIRDKAQCYVNEVEFWSYCSGLELST